MPVGTSATGRLAGSGDMAEIVCPRRAASGTPYARIHAKSISGLDSSPRRLRTPERGSPRPWRSVRATSISTRSRSGSARSSAAASTGAPSRLSFLDGVRGTRRDAAPSGEVGPDHRPADGKPCEKPDRDHPIRKSKSSGKVTALKVSESEVGSFFPSVRGTWSKQPFSACSVWGNSCGSSPGIWTRTST